MKCLLKDRYGHSAWHMAARRGYVELLEKMWDFAADTAAKTRPFKERSVVIKRQEWTNRLAHGSRKKPH